MQVFFVMDFFRGELRIKSQPVKGGFFSSGERRIDLPELLTFSEHSPR